MTDLERSHLELRAALRVAGQRIRQVQFGRRNDDPVLVLPLAFAACGPMPHAIRV